MIKDRTNSVNLKEFINLLKRHYIIIMITFLTCVLTIGYLTLNADNVYEATATLSIIEGGDLHGNLLNLSNVLQQKYVLKTQISILESNTLTAEVVKNLLNSPHKDTLRLFGFQKQKGKSHLSKRFLKLFLKKDTTETVDTFQSLMEAFYASTRVAYGRDSDIIRLKGRSTSPWEAALLVNTWLDTYRGFLQSDTKGEVNQTRELLDKKLKMMEEQLSRSEERLRRYQKNKKVISLSNETEQLVTQLANFESLYNETRTDLEALENQLSYLKNQLDENKKNLIENMVSLSSPVIQELQKQMAQIVAEKAAYEAQLLGAGFNIATDSRLRQMESRLKGVQDRIIEETKHIAESNFTQIDPLDQSQKLITEIINLQIMQKSLDARKNTLHKIVKEYNHELESLPDKSLELARLERDVQLNTKIYIMLREKVEEIRIREAGQAGIIRVLDRAMEPLYPIRPRKKTNLVFGCIFGLFLGLGLAFLRDYFQDTIRSELDVEELGVKVIGSIPTIRKEPIKIKFKPKKEESALYRARKIFPQLLTIQKDQYEIMEAYRTLRTSIYFSKKEQHWKTFLITSPGPGEGKSTTVANLAITMAKKGVNTLLVDTDLRKPVQDILFLGSKRKFGLTNHLSKPGEWLKAVRETSVKKLHLLASGPPVKNAPELIGSRYVAKFIQDAKETYHLVLFDSPPVLPVTDATILASMVDGVIIVIQCGCTTRESIRRTLVRLNDVHAKIIGAIVISIGRTQSYGYHGYKRAGVSSGN